MNIVNVTIIRLNLWYIYNYFHNVSKDVRNLIKVVTIYTVLTDRSHHRMGRSISFVLKKFNLEFIRT